MVERSALSRSIGNFGAVMVVNVCECVSDGLPGDVSRKTCPGVPL